MQISFLFRRVNRIDLPEIVMAIFFRWVVALPALSNCADTIMVNTVSMGCLHSFSFSFRHITSPNSFTFFLVCFVIYSLLWSVESKRTWWQSAVCHRSGDELYQLLCYSKILGSSCVADTIQSTSAHRMFAILFGQRRNDSSMIQV